MKEEVLRAVADTRVVAIIRGMDPEICVKLAEAYYAGGIRLVEVTYDQTGAPEKTEKAIKAIREKFAGRMHVGAGTVLTDDQLERTIAAGGEFMVTPSVNVGLIRKASAAGLVTMPGAFTPTEIVTAHEAGADFVKVFPVRALGPAYIKDVLAPLKHIRLLAVGGVSPDNAESFMKAGCSGVGVSGALVDKALISAGKFDEITKVAASLVAAVAK